MSFAMRQVLVVLCGTLLMGSMSFASIADLPPAYARDSAQIEKSHEEGINQFFKDLNEDCDGLDILHNVFRSIRTTPPAPPVFRIESRVLASCLRQEIWYCYSSFTEKALYRYTDCETDGPLFDE